MFFSGGGGSRNYNPESVLEKGAVMLTFALNVNPKTNKPDRRFRQILKTKRRMKREDR